MTKTSIFTIGIALLAACGPEFNPDLSDLEAMDSEGLEESSDVGDESSSGPETTGEPQEETGAEETGGETDSTGDETDGSDESGGDTDDGTGGEVCGDGIVNGDEICDGMDGVPLCDGNGEISCTNVCSELDVTGCDDLGLDPALAFPPQGIPCSDFGFGSDCAPTEACRLTTPEMGLCESCEGCASLGQSCSVSADCDILHTCYDGACVNVCALGDPQCGGQTCTGVGHPTHGVCL